jgi:hypothetical protein
MLTEQSSASDELILDREEWKESVKSGLKKPEKKYEVLFDENQKEYIRNHLFSLDAELYID